MHHLIGKYLIEHESLDIRGGKGGPANRAMVIVETRPNFWLPWVIANAIRVLGWDLYVFGTEEVLQLIDDQLKNVEFVRNRIPLMNVQGYSRMLLSANFWDVIQAEHILVFQTDCVLVRPPSDEMLDWAYIGAVCGMMDENVFIMNGGLSLRRKSMMLRAIDFITENERCEAEDIVFTKVLRLMRAVDPSIKLPDMNSCCDFAIESFGQPQNAIGIHATDKYYARTAIIQQVLASVGCESI